MSLLLSNMKRRIVQHGSSSLTITLPRKWVRVMGLEKGDELEVEIEGSDLVVSAKPRFALEKKVVTVSEFGVFTKNNLAHLYMLGYDEVEVQFQNEKGLEEIKERVLDCIGYEIIEQKPNRVYIKSIAHTLEDDFDVLLRKVFLVTLEMGKELVEALAHKEYHKLKEIRHQESLNNKFTMACARILNKRGYSKHPKRTLQMYELVKHLERVCDEYKYICDLFVGYTKEVSPELLEFFSQVNQYFERFYAMFYKFDPQHKEYIYKKRKELIAKGNEFISNNTGREALLVHYLVNIVAKTYDCAGAYFALIL